MVITIIIINIVLNCKFKKVNVMNEDVNFVELVSGNEDIINNATSNEITDVDFISKLNDEHKSKIINAVGGKSFDLEGNILNDKNEVILSATDFRKSLANQLNADPTVSSIEDVEAIVIDDVELTINENGEAIDADGNIVKTREEVESIIAEQSDGDTDLSDVGALMQKVTELTGFELTDANGNPVEFEPTVDGFAKREEYLVNTYGKNIAINALNSIFESKPELKELYEYIELNGSVEGFSFGEKPLDIKLTEENTDAHRNLIIKGQMMKGNSREVAETIANAFIDDGKSLAAAQAELEFINGRINEQATRRQQAIAVKQQEERQRQLEVFNKVKSIVSSGKLGDVTIPAMIKTRDANGNVVQRNRDEFLAYYAMPVKDGKTQYEIDATSRKLEDKLLDAYLLFTGNNNKDLIDSAAKTKHIKFIRKAKKGVGGNGQQQQRNVGGNKIDVNNIRI